MATTRSLSIARDGQNLHFWYGRRDPATGAYFTVGPGNDITACQITLLAKDGTTMQAAAAMTPLAALKGFVYDWTPGSALDARNVAYAFIQPTTAKPRALVPDDMIQLDLADVLQRLDEHDATEATRFATAEAARAAMASALTAEVDGVEEAVADLDGDVAAARAAILAAVDTRESEASASTRAAASAAEHDTTQAAIQSVQAAIAELDADVGEASDAASDDGSLHAKVKAVAGRQNRGRIEFTEG